VRKSIYGEAESVAIAYWCLTELKSQYGGSNAAVAKRLKVSRNVLDTLGTLTARNDPRHGRKAAGATNPLTDKELFWLGDVTRSLVYRAAVVESGLNPRAVTMADLPPLE
jgi:hypothetical protein